MSDLNELELRLKIRMEGEEALRRVASGTEAIGRAAAQTAAPADRLSQIIKEQTAAGQQLNGILTNVASGIGGTYTSAVRQAAAATLQSLGATKQQTDALLALNKAAKEVDDTFKRIRNNQEGIEKAFGAAMAENAARAEAAARKSAAGIRAEQKAAQAEINNTLRLTQSLTGALPGGVGYAGGRLLNFLSTPAGLTTAGVATLALGVTEMVKLANATGQYAREMTNLSASTGFTLEQTQLWSHITEVTGTNISAVVTQVRTMSKALSENSDEARKAKIALREFGLSDGFAYKGPEEQLRLLLDADARLRKTNEPLATTALATLGGRGALALRPYEGRFDELSSQVSGTGGSILDDEEIRKAREFDNQLKALGQTFEGLERVVGEKTIPILSEWVNALSSIIHNFETTGVNEGFSTLPGNVGGHPADRSWGYSLSHPFSVDAPYLGVPGAPKPPLSLEDLYGKEMASRDQAINAYLNSPAANGGGIRGQQLALERQLKDAEDALTVARDSESPKKVEEVHTANERILSLKQQVEWLTKLKSIEESTAELRDRAAYKNEGRLGDIEVNRLKMERDFIQQFREQDRDPAAIATLTANRDARRAAFSQEVKDEVARQLGLDNNLDLDNQLRGVERDFSHAQRISDLNLPAGANKDQLLGASQSAYQARMGLAAQENAIELAKAGNLTNAEEQRRAVKQANDDLVNKQQIANQERDERNRQIEKDDEARRNKAAEERQKLERQGERDLLLSEANRQQRLGALTNAPGADRTESVLTSFKSQVDLLNRLAKFDEQSINGDSLLSKEQKEIELLRVRQQLTVETNSADLEATEQLLEIDKKRTEEARAFSGELFKAITAKGGVGSQVGTFVRDQFKKIEETMFENLVTPTLQSVGGSLRGTFGSSSFANSLTSGTIFAGIPHLAGGGVTTGPTIAQIGEAGQEAVLPLSSLPFLTSGSTNPAMIELTDAVQDLTKVMNQTVNVTAKSPGGGLSWLMQSVGMGFLGSAAGYSISEMRRPRGPVTLPGAEQAGQEHWTPPDPNKIFGIVGGLLGFGGGLGLHALGGGAGGGLSNPAVLQNNAALTTNTAALQTLASVMTGGTGDATFLSHGGGAVPGMTGVSYSDLGLNADGSPVSLDNLNALPFLTGGSANNPFSLANAVSSSGASGVSQFMGSLGSFAQPGGLINAFLGGPSAALGTPSYSSTAGTGDINSLPVEGPGLSPMLSSIGGSTSGAAMAGAAVGAAAAAAVGVEGVISGIKQGGARGALGAVGSAAGTAALFDPEPISKAVLGAVALGAGLIKDVLGDPKQIRSNYINQALENQAWQAPPTINRTVNTQGQNVAYDALGHPLNTDFTGYSASDPSKVYYNGSYYNVPGSVNALNLPGQLSAATPQQVAPVPVTAAPVQTHAPSTTINLTVQALDSQSILDRSSVIGDAVLKELQMGAPVARQIQRSVLGS